MKHLIGSLLFFVILTSCKNEEEALPDMNDKTEGQYNVAFDSLLVDYYETSLKLNPLNATSLGDYRYNDTLPNFLSERYQIQSQNFYEDYLRRSENYKENTMSLNQILSKRILEWECEINLESYEFRQDLLPMDQFWTLQLTIGQLASGQSYQPFKTADDYKKWLKRLNNYLDWMHTAKEKMERGIAENYVLPKALIVKLAPQLKALTEIDLQKNLFYKPILQFPAQISASDKAEIKKAYTDMITNHVIPTYQDLYEFVSTEYLKAGRNTSGIMALEDGEELYNHLIKKYTTTTMTADEIHELGKKEVARIASEMEKVKTQVGFQGNLNEFFDHVRRNKKLMPFKNPDEVIENFNAIHKKMIPQLDKLFDLKPVTKFEVRRTESFREASASAEYIAGAADGSRPGIFYVPIPDIASYNTFSDESLFLHEAIPGHHYQFSLQQENDSLPKFRRNLWYSGYGEGWALYCESLGKELGLYDDPYQYFGMLSAEMHRAIRLVVDTGLHSKGWTREEAIEYSLQNEAVGEAGIISEIERYMALPGQALSYKIGQLKILELRHMAEDELGKKFNIAAFHNQILVSGAMPLNLLEEKIKVWIETYE